MALTGTAPSGGALFMLFASPQLSAGVSYNGNFRYIGHAETFASGSENILAKYQSKWGSPIAGKKIFIKVVQAIGGMQDNGTLFSCIVAT